MPSTLVTEADAAELIARDRGLLWHPYAPLRGPEPYLVRGAEGVRLTLEAADGERFDAIDAMSSWWSVIHGYRHPALDAAAHAQVDRVSHVMFGGLTHEPAVRLAERLVRLAPRPLEHVFFADSGSVAVEVALKLAVQVQRALGRPGRTRIAALRGGYHGDTAGAMSVCDPVDGMHAAFGGLVAQQVFLPRPPADPVAVGEWVAEARRLVERHRHELAAVIVEPVLQGAGGMHVYDPACLGALRELCDEFGLLLIADEIATGFGRTGRLFAVEWAGIAPDILCVGKALTGGHLSLAAMLCTERVGSALEHGVDGVLRHGPTFMANPLACAIADASLTLVESSWAELVPVVAAELVGALAPAADLGCVARLRTLGAVGVVELDQPVDVAAVTRAALRRGVWVRPFRNLVYTMPPYVASPGDVRRIGSAITEAIAEVHGA